MKKSLRKLIPAILMVLISASLMGTSTFAWFALNKTVTISGMQVNTKVGSNLLVSANTTEANFADKLAQAEYALLEPVSTTTATTFFYTGASNVVANGDAKTDTYIQYNSGDTAAFNTNYGTTGAVGYIDYSFYIKANSSADNSLVAMTKCNLLYNGSAVTEKAWRVAVFANKGAVDAASCDAGTTLTTPVSIITMASAANYTTDKAVTSTTALGDVTYGDRAVIENDLDAGHKRYYYVTVRLWLEGEDTTCTVDTFANLNEKYTLDLEFQIVAADTSAVNVIGSTGSAETYATIAASATSTLLEASVALSEDKLPNGETASSYQWYNATTGAAIDSATNSTYTGTDGLVVYCLVTTATGNIYRTNTVTLSAS